MQGSARWYCDDPYRSNASRSALTGYRLQATGWSNSHFKEYGCFGANLTYYVLIGSPEKRSLILSSDWFRHISHLGRLQLQGYPSTYGRPGLPRIYTWQLGTWHTIVQRWEFIAGADMIHIHTGSQTVGQLWTASEKITRRASPCSRPSDLLPWWQSFLVLPLPFWSIHGLHICADPSHPLDRSLSGVQNTLAPKRQCWAWASQISLFWVTNAILCRGCYTSSSGTTKSSGVLCALESTVSNSVYQGLDQR